RFRDDGSTARQMRYCAQDLLPAVIERQCLEERFEARLILDVQDLFKRVNLLLWQFHSIDDSTEEVHAPEIDLKGLDPDALKSFDSDEQDLNVRTFARPAVMLNSDLRKFALSPAFGFFEPQDFAGVVQPDGFCRCRQTSRNRFRDQ